MTQPRFIDEDVTSDNLGAITKITGRVTAVRHLKSRTFFDVSDHTGQVQVVVDATQEGVDGFNPISPSISGIKPGSYVSVEGILGRDRRDTKFEIIPSSIDVLAEASLRFEPDPFSVNPTEQRYAAQIFGNPDIYLANPNRLAVLLVMQKLNFSLHDYFQQHRFTLVQPPILTDKTLYDKKRAITATVHGEEVMLSQCATFELEPLALALKKVYTISPAFRNERGGSRRHLAEYTHAKAEMVEVNMEDLMYLAEDSLYYAFSQIANTCQSELARLRREIDAEGIRAGIPVRMTYDEALALVHKKGSTTEWGTDLTKEDEEILTKHIGDRYLWVMYKPCSSEGFPYRRKPDQPELSMTADLIAPHRAGEMVGVAEKITDPEELIQRMIEKGKYSEIRDYWGYILLRFFGMPPHGGIGEAPQRIIYGLLGLPHVEHTMPYARHPDRKIIRNHIVDLNPWGNPGLEQLIQKYQIR